MSQERVVKTNGTIAFGGDQWFAIGAMPGETVYILDKTGRQVKAQSGADVTLKPFDKKVLAAINTRATNALIAALKQGPLTSDEAWKVWLRHSSDADAYTSTLTALFRSGAARQAASNLYIWFGLDSKLPSPPAEPMEDRNDG